jgi:hypothetical protein
VDTGGTNPVIVEEQPKETPTRSVTSLSPALAPLVRSSATIPAKQEAIALMGFLANSFVHSSIYPLIHSFIHSFIVRVDKLTLYLENEMCSV